MIVSDYPIPELQRRLATSGLGLRTGPVSILVRSSLDSVLHGIALHYRDYTIEEKVEFADFHVAINRARGFRRWFRPQANFEIDGAAPFKPLPADHAFPMLEWGLNWCVSNYCHHYLAVHAAVVERSDRALILPAPPGSGKSTLCAGLISTGWRLLSDELTLIDPGSGNIVPIPRPVSLKNESIQVIRSFNPKSVFSSAVHDTVKGTVAHMRPPTDSVRRASEVVKPAWLVFPRYVSCAPPELMQLPKGRALIRLADNSFNYNLHGRRGFEAIADLVESCDCYDFSYGDLGAATSIFNRLADSKSSETQ